ncbi:unnamed protein product [Adineta steineri]|uniref:Uncharacterized protein n=2 Tax=Adineta steineri TaxID=433720 RepID=A0A813XSH8_9BILA|nr:unnamed protein product [Adineta steineri]CAF0869199.1 unnamed protein product [Adineta steineri]CAF1014623.1 unnamed protein product [Adineta steineri]
MPTSSSAPVSRPQSSDQRSYHEFERSPYTAVPSTALSYGATQRIASLAKPKYRRDTTVRDGFSRYYLNPTYSGVTRAASNAECSSRVSELAQPIKLQKEHRFEHPSPRPVSRGALNYRASSKIHELSAPRKPPTVE